MIEMGPKFDKQHPHHVCDLDFKVIDFRTLGLGNFAVKFLGSVI